MEAFASQLLTFRPLNVLHRFCIIMKFWEGVLQVRKAGFMYVFFCLNSMCEVEHVILKDTYNDSYNEIISLIYISQDLLCVV